MDRKVFYDNVRGALFGGRLSVEQVGGMNAILDEWLAQGLNDHRWLAYMLATAYHETAKTMQPVMETRQPSEAQNPSVDEAIRRLEKAWAAGKLPWVKTPYWRKDSDGKSWLGRGLVQITHEPNYQKFGLTDDPDRALDLKTAIKIMFIGMTKGSFTNKKLGDYFKGAKADWVNARRIINSLEKANAIAGYGKAFLKAIEAAGKAAAGG